MSKAEHRRFTAEQKLEILREAEQPEVTVSAVCRRHALAPSVFYKWRALANTGSAVALKRDAKRMPRKDDIKKKDLKLDELYRVPAETKAAVMQIVQQTKRRSGWRVVKTLAALGIRASVYYA